MITHDNLDQLLDQLGFTKSGQKHSKTIVDATLTVDRKNGEISYPEAQGLKIHLRTTCNLAADENFVVLECVNRLLEKGYKPANIELEPQFKLGHGMSGGRADILVKDNASKPLLIIECKTAGSEFTRAWKKTLNDGDQQKQYHAFATILRQHNVSGRENAFDKLVNLLLCKLVDETLNPQDLKFYWKGVAYDSHFDLFDRLQQLYKEGMGKFLGEPITYIDRSAVQNAMRFIKQNPDATQRAVWQLFLQQKFFTNNDFSFIDVHNEKLFYQNAEVLLKVIQMWQDIRLTNEAGDNQFLGDLFEGFLDQGVKQSEGQYFTPLPICRFIMMSLPLQTLVARHAAPPKVIDYACGAGHFLTELARQINPLVAAAHPQADIAGYHQAIVGIEKEYRLSKVAKVAAFMHGQRDIAICYGDALIKAHPSHPQIADDNFDILVANPPYSVKGFLETLPEAERTAYALTDTATALDTNNSIECFFIERAKQLLKAGGIAAIILPASILSNGNGTYLKTREILIQYFDIVAIAEFGSGTFGKTGTNTVTLFLRRKATAPDTAEHYRERVAEWFAGGLVTDSEQPIYQDEHLIDRYCAHVGVTAADYKTLLQGDAHGPWCTADHFDAYTAAFNDSTEIKNLTKQKKFNALPQAEQDAEIDRRYLAFVHAIERDKLLHFVLASDQPNPVLIVKSPSDTKAQKQFLGYDWSSAKGDEGIKLIKDAQGRHQTVLYDENDRDNTEKLNALISANFDGRPQHLPENLKPYASTARLVDMLDFSRVTFEKQIGLSPNRTTEDFSWSPTTRLAKLDQVAQRVSSLIDPQNNQGTVLYVGLENIESNTGKLIGNLETDYSEIKSTKTSFSAGDVLYGKLRPNLNKVHLAQKSGICSTDILVLRFQSADHAYFYTNYMLSKHFNAEVLRTVSGQQLPRTSWESLRNLKLPIPAPETQQQIANECQAVDNQVTAAKTAIATAQATVDGKIGQIYASTVKLSQVATLNPSKTELRQIADGTLVSFVEMASVSERGLIANSVAKTLGSLRKGSYTYFAENDILIAKITPCMENGKCALATGLENGIGMGSTEFHVIRANPPRILPAFLFALLNREDIRQRAAKAMTGASGHRRVPASFYESLEIALPPLAEQRRIVAEVAAEQHAITAAEAVIAAAPARKQAILERHL